MGRKRAPAVLHHGVWIGGWILVVLAGCTGTTQIQTAPPQPANEPAAAGAGDAPLASVSVEIETGASRLPDDVQALQFRVTEVRLKQVDGDWIGYPADLNAFDVRNGRPVRKTVLATQVDPVPYDSVALALAEVFVLYDANAGGPLTMPRDLPIRVAYAIRPEAGASTRVRLRFEPGASLSQGGADCRWYFVPFLVPATEP